MIGSATGKVILVGEHFVVHGAPAIVSGIGKKLRVIARFSDEDRVWPGSWWDEKTMEALRRVHAMLTVPPLSIKIFSEFPAGAGLGASGAFAVALGRALGVDDVLAFAHEVEKAYHGTPSGIDTAAAYFGTPLIFRKGEDPRPLEPAGITLVALYAGDRRRSVKELVEGVRKLKERDPDFYSSLERAYMKVYNGVLEALREGDPEHLGRCFDVNQSLLRKLGVSSERIEHAIDFLKERGAIGAKLTGGGDGGFVIGVYPARSAARPVLREALRRFRYALLLKV